MNASVPWISAACAIVGAGLGPSSIAQVLAIQNVVAERQRGVATSLVPFFRTVGGSIGVGALGGLLAAGLGDAPRARRRDRRPSSGLGRRSGPAESPRPRSASRSSARCSRSSRSSRAWPCSICSSPGTSPNARWRSSRARRRSRFRSTRTVGSAPLSPTLFAGSAPRTRTRARARATAASAAAKRRIASSFAFSLLPSSPCARYFTTPRSPAGKMSHAPQPAQQRDLRGPPPDSAIPGQPLDRRLVVERRDLALGERAAPRMPGRARGSPSPSTPKGENGAASPGSPRPSTPGWERR